MSTRLPKKKKNMSKKASPSFTIMTIFFIRYFYHKNEGTLFHIDFKNGELHPTARQIV